MKSKEIRTALLAVSILLLSAAIAAGGGKKEQDCYRSNYALCAGRFKNE